MAVLGAGVIAPPQAQEAPVTPPAPGVYKWVDRNGLLHYDDASLTEPRLTLDILDARRIAPAPDQGAPDEFIAEVGRRCSQTRERLQNYASAQRLYGRDPSGNVYLLSATQTGLALGTLGRDESRYCGVDSAKQLYAAVSRQSRVEAAK